MTGATRKSAANLTGALMVLTNAKGQVNTCEFPQRRTDVHFRCFRSSAGHFAAFDGQTQREKRFSPEVLLLS